MHYVPPIWLSLPPKHKKHPKKAVKLNQIKTFIHRDVRQHRNAYKHHIYILTLDLVSTLKKN